MARDISGRVDRALGRLGWSQTQLAHRVGISVATLSHILHGRRPGRKHLPKIAELLQVPIDWLTTGLPLQPWELQIDAQQIGAVVVPYAEMVATKAAELAEYTVKLRDLLKATQPDESRSMRPESRSPRAAAERHEEYRAEASRRNTEGDAKTRTG